MREKMIKVADADGLVRDPHSNSILKTDINELRAFKSSRNSSGKVQSLEQKVDSLENRLGSIESLLMSIVNKL